MPMKTFRLTDNDLGRLEKVAKKYIDLSEKEGIRGITTNTVLRSLILLGETVNNKEMLKTIKDLKVFG